jgi:hypothetical protein
MRPILLYTIYYSLQLVLCTKFYEKTSFSQFELDRTALDRFFEVQSGFGGYYHNRQPVAVAVRPNGAKKPD